MTAVLACDRCLRQAWLVQRLGGRLEIARHEEVRLPEVLALSDEDLIAALGGPDPKEIRAEHASFDPGPARAAAARAGLTPVCVHDPLYPRRLAEMRDAPSVLHVAGALERLERLGDEEVRTVAIVGTRRATRDGLEVARALGRDLALAGVPVMSGMALGIDSAAQRGAVDAGGLSVAVLAGCADVPYPRRERALHASLVQKGLVVSEAPTGGRAWKWSFPARNRIIAGLADLTVVVEAAERSGSLITADLAMRLGRDVAAVPGPVTSSVCAGTNGLLRDGAVLVRDAQDVLDALYGAGGAPVLRTTAVELEPHLAVIFDAVAEGRNTVAALAGTSTERAEQAMIGLTELELRGLVRREPGGRYAVAL
ncbi:MAG: Rossmann fold nucleotide-binding protein Smf possibly involved in DNA uptake [uncultured Solirubrobacteraceae bacterium]|uniref:Rossmann fold nucleotide-binding protein Smf possibly involved in DNA uptake n=1 Tax=uncultured Solirubrobacteraceae bacterium TaxID=1162706 RepID=A0A6J4T4J6_9ACTN|nr:MAG: Rossmann fold nucleotide-binding protein Smf possibly involved in DNA uptake [uncultured Solirubrobacteraceae bacterium]